MSGLEPKVGDVVGRRFVLDKRIGTGGFGSVWRARDRAGRDARVALKVLHDHHLADPRIRARFEQEAAILAKLDHPSIAKCIAWDIDDETGYLALEYVDGVTLARSLVRHVKKGRHFELDEVRRIFSELCAAIQFAHHQDVIHRDIKPANIMLLERAGTLYVKVLDFGVAKILAETGRERTTIGTLLGSLHYMGPEQAKGLAVDHRTDVFALGSVLFEMLTLRRAWLRNTAGDPIQAGAPVKDGDAENNDLALIMRLVNDPRPRAGDWREGLTPEIDEVLARALAVEAEERYPTVESFAREVDRVLSARPRVATPRVATADLPPTSTRGFQARAEPTPTPTPAPILSRASEPGREVGHTFETSRPEAFMHETAALWSRVDEALVQEAASEAEEPEAPSGRPTWVIWAAAFVLLVVLGVGASLLGRHLLAPAEAPLPATPPAGRLVDVP